MAVTFRHYVDEQRFGADYRLLRQFYVELGDISFPFGRWDWMISHSYLDAAALPKIGLWLDEDRLMAVCNYDTEVDGSAFIALRPGYEHLYPQLIAHGEQHFAMDGRLRLPIPDDDAPYQAAAAALGYVATSQTESDTVFLLENGVPDYALPGGFSIVSLHERPDPYEYGSVLWKGFNREARIGPYDPTPQTLAIYQNALLRPHVNLDIKVAVTAPDGSFAAFCGMWYDPQSPHALVEPVATVPRYRRLGLGRAAVLEGLRRCARLGATRAYVGSPQQFYYSMGFRPCRTVTHWVRSANV